MRALNNRGIVLRVFPHTTLWHGGSLMVGAKRSLVLERDAFDRKLQDEERTTRSGIDEPRNLRDPAVPVSNGTALRP